jgi:hypothetical protein
MTPRAVRAALETETRLMHRASIACDLEIDAMATPRSSLH